MATPSAKKAPKKRTKVMSQPVTAAGGAASLTSIVPFLPPSWQPYGYAAAAVLGIVAPILASRQQQRATD